ncbi:MAG: molybdopterin oxidoreductase family protein, partial [Desulfosalsimonas sp.]
DDWRIIAGISGRMGFPMEYNNASEIFDELTLVTPSYAGINYERIEEQGLHWPCPSADHPGTPVLHSQGFPIGKGVLHAIDYIPPAEQIDDEYPLYLTTGRVIYQYHTRSMTGRTDGLNDRAPESFVEISPADAEKYGLKDGDKVKIASRRGEIVARMTVSEKAVDGTVFIPFHYAEAAANRLTNSALDPVSKIPEYKVCAVNLSSAA